MIARFSPPAGSIKQFASRVLVATALVIGLLLLLLVLWYAVQAILLTFAGVLLTILLRGFSDPLAENTRLSEMWALAIVIIVLLGLTIGVGFVVAPQVNEQFLQLQQRLPEAMVELRSWLQQFDLGRWLIDLIPTQRDLEDGRMLPLIQQITGAAYTAVQVFFGFLVLLFVTLYLSVNPRMYTNGFLHLFPFSHRPRAAQVLASIGYTLRWWLIGTLIRMVTVGAMTFVGLWLLDVPLALLLSILAFLLDFVPYFGPIVAAVPAVVLAFVESPQLGLYVTILYIVVQQVESLIISPVIYQRTVYMPPVVTILAQVLLFAMVGALGVILATPLIAVVLVLVKMLYMEQTLGDHELQQSEQDVARQQPVPLPEGSESGEQHEHESPRTERPGGQ
jgi:predicted PurR-regulated permease PerM